MPCRSCGHKNILGGGYDCPKCHNHTSGFCKCHEHSVKGSTRCYVCLMSMRLHPFPDRESNFKEWDEYDASNVDIQLSLNRSSTKYRDNGCNKETKVILHYGDSCIYFCNRPIDKNEKCYYHSN